MQDSKLSARRWLSPTPLIPNPIPSDSAQVAARGRGC